MAARGLLAAGDVYIARILNGVDQGLQGPFESSKFSIQPNVDQKDLVSKGKNTYGQVIESVGLAQPTDVNLDLKEIIGDVLAIAMLGSTTSVLQASDPGTTPVPMTVPKAGSWIASGFRNLSATGVVVKDSAGTLTYQEGEDYIVNRSTGAFKFLVSTVTTPNLSAFPVNLLLTLPRGVSNGTKISGATQSNVRARLFFDGKNIVDDSPIQVEVFEAIFTSSGEFDFLADDFNTLSLTGKMKTPLGRSSPFEVVTIEQQV